MNTPFVVLLLFIIGVIVYTAFRIRRLMRQSERQWREIDYSKLREWKDEED